MGVLVNAKFRDSMRRGFAQTGFSLLEMVVVVAVILILAGMLLGVGKYIKIRAEIDLTKSELEVLVTALQQYYDDFTAFPFDTDMNNDGLMNDDYLVTDLEADLNGLVSGGVLEDIDASSAALFYFLDKGPNSRKIVDALSGSLVSNKDASGAAITFTFTATSETIDLPRFIDVWGNSIRYEYLPDTAFPILTSAGPDGAMNTSDDVSSK